MALCVVMVPGRGGLPATYRGKPATSRSMEVPVTEPSALDADSSSAEGGTREAELLEKTADTRPEPDARNLFQREAERSRVERSDGPAG